MEKDMVANLKTLSIDMIHQANSGHPGIALSAAPILYTLYAHHMNINVNDLSWMNRDRFVLSAGHGSALLYATLHMAGYNLPIENLKKFRHVSYRTPGHPEFGVTPGVEMSTGPLGQGLASAVGMAIGEKLLENKYRFPKKSKLGKDRSLIDYRVYVLCSDGDLMEGVSYEACSLAGSLKLNHLVVLYDSNSISLDGPTDHIFTEDVTRRFEAMGWNTEVVKDGTSISEIDRAINRAKESMKPSFIEIKTVLGNGSLEAGRSSVHGKPLSDEDIRQLKEKLQMKQEPFFVDPQWKADFERQIITRSSVKYGEWAKNYREYIDTFLDGDSAGLTSLFTNQLQMDLTKLRFDLDLESKESTRVTNGRLMNRLATMIPNWVGGSADLATSTYVTLEDLGNINQTLTGKNISFGVREHAMASILNGLAVTNFRPFGSTFLAFSDYMKPGIRMSAMMNLPVTYIFTHDSVNIGQDGPTHQPIEQLSMLRAIPNLDVYRPCDGHELIGCWNMMLNRNNPSALVLSRADAELLGTTNALDTSHGAYIVRKETDKLYAIIIATGSEVATSIRIANAFYHQYQLDIRVVSMPCMELFLQEEEAYRTSILPSGIRTIVIEAGSSFGWHQFVYNPKYLITLDRFGTSGTTDEVMKYMEFTEHQIAEKVGKLLLK